MSMPGRNLTEQLVDAIKFGHRDKFDKIIDEIIKEHNDKTINGLVDGQTPLHVSASHAISNDPYALAEIQVLIEEGADVNIPDSKGRTPINIALSQSPLNWSVIEFLFNRGADLKIADESGIRPIERLDNLNSLDARKFMQIAFVYDSNLRTIKREDIKKRFDRAIDELDDPSINHLIAVGADMICDDSKQRLFALQYALDQNKKGQQNGLGQLQFLLKHRPKFEMKNLKFSPEQKPIKEFIIAWHSSQHARKTHIAAIESRLKSEKPIEPHVKNMENLEGLFEWEQLVQKYKLAPSGKLDAKKESTQDEFPLTKKLLEKMAHHPGNSSETRKMLVSFAEKKLGELTVNMLDTIFKQVDTNEAKKASAAPLVASSTISRPLSP